MTILSAKLASSYKAGGLTMLEDDEKAFWAAADEFNCWIDVRKPNQHLERWIEDPTCIPKPVRCKAKTADRGPLRGLVVNPLMCKRIFEVFSNPLRAVTFWHTFARSINMHPEKLPLPNKYYAVIESGDERGALTFCKKKIHSDYDLMAIRPISKKKPSWVEVRRYLNQYLTKKGMIRHVTEFMPLSGGGRMGTSMDEEILSFGPNRSRGDYLNKMDDSKPWN
jgi:hypothetical protein